MNQRKPKPPPRATADVLALSGVALIAAAAFLVSASLGLFWLGAAALGVGLWIAKKRSGEP